MKHFVMDAFKGYRSRLDDISLVYEILEEVPHKLGMKTVMPPFVLPYYNGVIPEDCGISGFVYLSGGHFTVHTFSYREVYFVDFVCYSDYDDKELEKNIISVFPADQYKSYVVNRNKRESFPDIKVNKELDFGPHLFWDIHNYQGPKTMDDLFTLFDKLPGRIEMTPIMRPYAIMNKFNGEEAISIMTMIAESHICLHYFKNSNEAYLDLFSCKFFDYDMVGSKLKEIFKGDIASKILLPRGSNYQIFRNNRDVQHKVSNDWVNNI